VPASDYREPIQRLAGDLFAELPDAWKWIEGQVQAESGGNPIALSPTGARGLLQMEPATAAEMGVKDLDDPEDNLRGGIAYLHALWVPLAAVGFTEDRLYWAFASYNCGPVFVRKALALATRDGYGSALAWPITRCYLFHHDAFVELTNGRKLWADYRAVWGYVESIWKYRARIAGA
jgi:membrane-bound lytic murein transglycosylase MltF